MMLQLVQPIKTAAADGLLATQPQLLFTHKIKMAD